MRPSRRLNPVQLSADDQKRRANTEHDRDDARFVVRILNSLVPSTGEFRDAGADRQGQQGRDKQPAEGGAHAAS
jgi:hypothetical protein